MTDLLLSFVQNDSKQNQQGINKLIKTTSVNLSRLTSGAKKKFIPSFSLARSLTLKTDSKKIVPLPGKEPDLDAWEFDDENKRPESKMKV